MKMIAKPKDGKFELLLEKGEYLYSNRPSVVTMTEFMNLQILKGLITVVEKDLPDHATDAEFEKFFNDSDKDEAMAAQNFRAKVEKDEPQAASNSEPPVVTT